MPTPQIALDRISACKQAKSEKLDLSNTGLYTIPEEIAELFWLTGLDFSYNQIRKIEGLDSLTSLMTLYLGLNQISEIEGLNSLTSLKMLTLSNNQIRKIEGLAQLTALDVLNLSDNQISKIEGLTSLKSLKSLFLFKNQISEIEGLASLMVLTRLDLSSNKISKIEGLTSLKCLVVLLLSSNQIRKIEGLTSLKSLKVLNLSNNQISRIEELNSNRLLNQLDSIDLSGNYIEDPPVSFLTNVSALLGYFKSKSDSQIDNRYLKVNILGEGRIGKTQLFRFLKKEKYIPRAAETHGTNTLEYEFRGEYQAKIWDFGGQSYHHGFHQLFIRPRDFNIVLWTTQKDSYGYWLGVTRNYSPKASLYLVQNVWTETDHKEIETLFKPHSIVYPDSQKLDSYQIGLDSVFAINVRELFNKESPWQVKHAYFLNSLESAMAEHISKEKTFAQVSQKWLAVKKALDSSPFTELYLSKQDFKARFAESFDENAYEALLLYLEFAGNLLYFKGIPKLENYIFPDPPRLSAWIYDKILDKAFKEHQNGLLDFAKLTKKIGSQEAVFFWEIMSAFGLIFEAKDIPNHMVIPQFLPEQNNTFKRYLLDLIPYSFCLRFEDFIHEARIFQFISEYGIYAEDETAYWRYGIVFIKSGVRTVVYYDQKDRIVNVHIEDTKSRTEIAQEVFDYFVNKEERKTGPTIAAFAQEKMLDVGHVLSLLNEVSGKSEFTADMLLPKELEKGLNAYFDWLMGISIGEQWKEKIELAYKSFKSLKLIREPLKAEEVIEGAQLCVNQNNYFDIKETILYNTDGLNIGICVDTRQKIKLDYLAINLLGMENHKLPKVFISYNRKDLEFKEELRTHLSILERYDLLKAWSCDEIRAGKWDKQIQTELEEADIIIYMISHHFMASEYIMEKEVKKGIQLAEKYPNKKIMCVVVRECAWRHWTALEEKFKSIKGDKDVFSESMDLTQYQFLPYHRYLNQEGNATKEEIVAMERWGRTIYDVRNVAFEQIVSKIIKEVK